jgi:hypothetical protein
MDTSRYIARLMGPVMLVIGIGMAAGMFVEGESYSSLMKEFIGPRALILITGVLALLAGLIIVNAHNLWVPDWRVLITALGWLAILRGVMNLVLPDPGANHGRSLGGEPCRCHCRGRIYDRATRDPLDHGL